MKGILHLLAGGGHVTATTRLTTYDQTNPPIYQHLADYAASGLLI